MFEVKYLADMIEKAMEISIDNKADNAYLAYRDSGIIKSFTVFDIEEEARRLLYDEVREALMRFMWGVYCFGNPVIRKQAKKIADSIPSETLWENNLYMCGKHYIAATREFVDEKDFQDYEAWELETIAFHIPI